MKPKSTKSERFLERAKDGRRDPRPLSAEAAHLALKVFHQALTALGGSSMSPAHALRALMAATLSSSATVMTREDIARWLRDISDEIELDIHPTGRLPESHPQE